jgi:hypothetical protein
MNIDRWNPLEGGDELSDVLQECMKQMWINEALIETISTPFIASWAHFVTRVAQSIVGLKRIKLSEDEEPLDEEKFQAIEGVSEEIQRNIFKLMPGELYSHAIREIKKLMDISESNSALLRIVSESISPNDLGVAKVITGVCDYLIAEHIELAGIKYDGRSYSSSGDLGNECEDILALSEVKAWNKILTEKEERDKFSAEATTDDSIEIDSDKLVAMLRARYGSISWYFINEVVVNDEELKKLWKHLDLELLQNPHESIVQCGTRGVALIDELTTKLAPLSSQDLYEIAMKLPIVDRFGNLLTDDDYYKFDITIPDLLTSIRECSDNASIDIDLGETTMGFGATLFQVLAALIYQCHSGAIGHINCLGSVPIGVEYGAQILPILLELFPTKLSLDKLEVECEGMSLFDETMYCSEYGNRMLISLTYSGNLPKLVNFPALKVDVNTTYVAAEYSGLHDEDRLGEVSGKSTACNPTLSFLY